MIIIINWNKTKKELIRAIDNQVIGIFPKDMETPEELFNRAKNFLHKILAKHHNDAVLFVGHREMNKSMIAGIMGKGLEGIKSIETQPNTGISIFENDEDKNHKIYVFNCIKHLD